MNAVFTVDDNSQLPPAYLPKTEDKNTKSDDQNFEQPPTYDMFLNQNPTTSSPFVVFSVDIDTVRIMPNDANPNQALHTTQATTELNFSQNRSQNAKST